MRKFFEFQNAAKINCGEKALDTIGKELSVLGAKKPILITSSNAAKLGVKEKVVESLKNGGIDEMVLADVAPAFVDATYAQGVKATYISERCDAIVAVGGDEAMDVAKVVKLLLSQDWDEILPIAQECVIESKRIPLIAIPSENGSGKEANGYMEVGEYYLSASALIPNVVIIDEDVAMAAPTREIAACGVYALANAIESYLEAEDADVSTVYAEKAIRLLADNLLIAVTDGDNKDACRATALASTLAGIAYGANPYGAAHALAEGLHAVTGELLEEMFALSILPAVAIARKKYENKVKKLYYLLVGADEYAETPSSERADKAVSKVEELLAKLGEATGLATKISQTKITRETFGKIADAAVDKRASITANGPIGKDVFIDMLNRVY